MIAGTENGRLNHRSLRLDEMTAKQREFVFACNINDFLAGCFTSEDVDAIARRFLRGLVSARRKVRFTSRTVLSSAAKLRIGTK